MELNECFKKGYRQALADVFHVLMENMDDDVQEDLLNDLKLKRYE